MAPNANVLIHAGASGVGQSAIQVARLAGAKKIFTTAGTPEKCELVKSLGADFAINYRAGEDFAEVVSRETEGKGADLIVDLVGASYWAQNVASAAVDSRIVIIAMMSGGKIPEFDMRPLQTKRVWICTTTLRVRSVDYQIGVRNFFVQNILPGLVKRKIKTVIDKVYSWRQIGEAHERMENSKSAGKIICVVD
jgi:NADPH:quinone reductase-like Zn-dependent oxidoreductase